MNDFSSNVDQLVRAVNEACAERPEWPAKVVAGIRAALDFTAANPGSVRDLVESRGGEGGADYPGTIERISELFASEAPRERRVPASTDQAVIGGIATVIVDHVRLGRLDRLDEVAPDLVYLALLPYLGFDEARRHADSTARPPGERYEDVPLDTH